MSARTTAAPVSRAPGEPRQRQRRNNGSIMTWPSRSASALAVALVAVLLRAPAAQAETASATRYCVSLGDSLAASVQPGGDLTHGYAERLHALFAARDPKLKPVKLGCTGESTTSTRGHQGIPGGRELLTFPYRRTTR